MSAQIAARPGCKEILERLEDSSRQISMSTGEQKVGKSQASEVVIQVRDIAQKPTEVIVDLKARAG